MLRNKIVIFPKFSFFFYRPSTYRTALIHCNDVRLIAWGSRNVQYGAVVVSSETLQFAEVFGNTLNI